MLAIYNGVGNLVTQSPCIVASWTLAALITCDQHNKIISAILVVILVMLVLFYRDPAIKTGFPDSVIMSPCYGTVKDVHHDEKLNIYRIVIFLSPFDIHTQTMPANGYVSDMVYDANGRFELAYKINKSRYNEKIITTIVNPVVGEIKVRQIAGKFVRRIANIDKRGKKIMCGEKLGMIKFGSRVDLEVPCIRGLAINVKSGDYVNGSDTLIARITDSP